MDTQPIDPTHPVNSRKKNLFLLGSILLVAGLIAWIFIFNGNIKNVSENLKGNNPTTLLYPFIGKSSENNADVIFFYSIKEKSHIETDFIAQSVFSAPNNLHSVVQKLNGELYIITNNYSNLSSKAVPMLNTSSSGFAGWSPDSQKFLYYSWEKTDTSNHEVVYSLYNIEDGLVTKLDVLKTVGGSRFYFLDNSTLLVQEEVTPGWIGYKVYTYNLINKEKSKPILFKDFSLAFDFLSTGNKWFFVQGNTEPNSSLVNFTFADFPKTEGVIIDSGKWADIQPFFHVSPNDLHVAYTRQKLVDSLGIMSTWIYDISAGTKKEIAIGRPLGWVNQNTIMVEDFFNDNLISAVDISGESVPLKSDFFNSYPLGNNEKGFLYSSPLYNGYALRFYNADTRKSKTIIISRSINERSKYTKGEVYFLSADGKLSRFNPYSLEKNLVIDLATKVNIEEERILDFLISNNDILYTVCSYGKGCELRTTDLTSGLLKDKRKINDRLEVFELLIENYNQKENMVRINQLSSLNDCCSSTTTVFDFNLNNNTSNILYVRTCSGDEGGEPEEGSRTSECYIEQGEENYKKMQLEKHYCNNINIERNNEGSLKLSGVNIETILYSSIYIGCIK